MKSRILCRWRRLLGVDYSSTLMLDSARFMRLDGRYATGDADYERARALAPQVTSPTGMPRSAPCSVKILN